jgi:hypothetical protein
MERPDIATYPPDVLLVFIGYSKDAEAEAFAIRDLQREMQRELEHLQSVQKSRLRFTQGALLGMGFRRCVGRSPRFSRPRLRQTWEIWKALKHGPNYCARSTA